MELFEEFGAQLCIRYNFVLIWCILMKNNQFRVFPGKIVTSLAGILTMEKDLFKYIFWHNFFLINRSLIFCDTIKDFWNA